MGFQPHWKCHFMIYKSMFMYTELYSTIWKCWIPFLPQNVHTLGTSFAFFSNTTSGIFSPSRKTHFPIIEYLPKVSKCFIKQQRCCTMLQILSTVKCIVIPCDTCCTFWTLKYSTHAYFPRITMITWHLSSWTCFIKQQKCFTMLQFLS